MSDDKLRWKHLWYKALPEDYSVEDLYLAFRERLMAELVARGGPLSTGNVDLPLVSKEDSK